MFGLPPLFWLLWAAQLINRLGGFIFTFLPLYLTDARGLTPAEAGAVTAVFALGGLVGSQIGGPLADVYGRRPALFLGMGAATLSCLALGLADNTPTIVACT